MCTDCRDITLTYHRPDDFTFTAHSARGNSFLERAFAEVQGDVTWAFANTLTLRARRQGLVVVEG